MFFGGLAVGTGRAAPARSTDTARPITTAPADPVIARALADVSAAHIRQTVSTLVDFHTRNTLSSMDADLPPNTGATAAAKWIEQQFTVISEACHGCLEVKTDTFTEPGDSAPRSRIKVPTTITNVYAIMRGSDSAQAGRMYLVTGHYDSRRTDVMDSHGLAPGANDDASGTAVSIECARVLSRHRWPATIVFVAVAGEEQGLDGSRHLAKLARKQGAGSWQAY
jgi:Zn-dependent M28 family amino/carboxypeptidase